MDFLGALTKLESDDSIHIARLLVLLGAFATKDPSNEIEGLTKLVKLDFLLRYPVALERALAARGKSGAGALVEPHERDSVESKMVRYRFGPWDHRYRRWLALLFAKGLIIIGRQKSRTITIKLTEKGLLTANQLGEREQFELIQKRAKTLKANFDIGGTALMRFIYETFPDVVTLRMNAPIPP
jgi:hypothetical protein